MSRIIDADLLIKIVKNVREHIKEVKGKPVPVDAVDMFSLFVEMIDNQKTVYDIDEIVEQLEENYSCDVGNLKMISVDKAIEIVKGGVK